MITYCLSPSGPLYKNCCGVGGLSKTFIFHSSQGQEVRDQDAAAATAKLHQSCLTLCDPIDGSPPGSAVPGILQARILEWVAISFSNQCMKVKNESEVAQLCPTPGKPMDCSLPGSSIHGIFQARVTGLIGKWKQTNKNKQNQKFELDVRENLVLFPHSFTQLFIQQMLFSNEYGIWSITSL